MRSYGCTFNHMNRAKKLVRNSNKSCWNGLNIRDKLYRAEGNNETYIIDLDPENKDYIFIEEYIEPEVSDNARNRVVTILNRITPCNFETIDKKVYIKVKLLENHYSNLIILNFIRMFWYSPPSFDLKQFYIDVQKLMKRGSDPLEFLLTCVKKNVIEGEGGYSYGNHSLVYPGIKPKTIKQLLAHTGNSMEQFLKS